LDGFTADLFASAVPQENALASISMSDAQLEQYRVIPKQTAAGSVAKIQMLNVAYPYQNQDGNPSQYPRLLYLRLVVGGSSGAKRFILVLKQLAPSFR
jgi:hypothetical protein